MGFWYQYPRKSRLAAKRKPYLTYRIFNVTCAHIEYLLFPWLCKAWRAIFRLVRQPTHHGLLRQ